MTPEVEAAVQEIRDSFPGHEVEVENEPQGGACVIVRDLPLGEQYTPNASWIGFLITFQYPRADVYPHFMAADVRRADGAALGEGFSQSHTFSGNPAIQVSRVSRNWDASTDTAALKLAKVLDWISSR